MADAMLEVRLHSTIRARSVRPDAAVALRASQLSFSVCGNRLIDRDPMPRLVRPQFAVLDHALTIGHLGWSRYARSHSINENARTRSFEQSPKPWSHLAPASRQT